MSLDVGFLGLGEAGRALGGALAGAGAAVAGWDVAFGDADRGPELRRRVEAAGIETVEDPEALPGAADTVVSTVAPSSAREAAASVARRLERRHLFLDLNSLSPAGKAGVRAALARGEGRFVEGAVMGSVPKHGRRVPILLCGPDADELAARLAPLEMRLEVLGPEFGAAAATKMCRSLMIKGLECLLAECLSTARAHGVADRVLESIGETMPGIDWPARADYALRRMALHAARRGHEMDEVAETVSELGIEPGMARAAARWFRRVAALELNRRFGDDGPRGFDDVLTAMDGARGE